MDYFRQKYSDVHFVACSESHSWCKENLAPLPNVTLVHGTRQEDFSLLVTCDHIIITFGSFSWWAAWLNSGDVVYFNHPYSGLLEYRNNK